MQNYRDSNLSLESIPGAVRQQNYVSMQKHVCIKRFIWMEKLIYNQQLCPYFLKTHYILLVFINDWEICFTQNPLLLGQCGSRTDNWRELFFYCVLNLLLGNKALLCYSVCSGLNLRAHQSGKQEPMTADLMGIAFHHAWNTKIEFR